MFRTIVIPPLAFLLASCATTHAIEPQIASPSRDFASAERFEVQLDSFSFTPRDVELPADTPIVLVLHNVSNGGHNFSAPEFFAAAQVQRGDASLIAPGAVEVPGGGTVEIHLVPVAGTYDLDCTHLGHKAFGMTGSIIVQ